MAEIIAFGASPDVDAMDRPALEAYLAEIRRRIAALDERIQFAAGRHHAGSNPQPKCAVGNDGRGKAPASHVLYAYYSILYGWNTPFMVPVPFVTPSATYPRNLNA